MNINFMGINLMEWLLLVFGMFGFILTIATFIYSKLTDKKFKVLEQLFIEKFGYAPLNMTFGKSAGIFFVGLRDQIFLEALSPSRFFADKLIKPEERKFIQSLPKELTNWVIIKYKMARYGLGFFIISAIIAYINSLF